MSKAVKMVFREDFLNYPSGKINWFPGHMRKARKQLTERMNKIDLFLEVRDARIPFTSHNTLIDELLPSHKKKIVIYNKADLANAKMTQQYMQYTREVEKLDCFEMSAKKHLQVDKFISYVKNKINPKFKTIGNWMMIGGIPNVGKSTIINTLRKKDEDITTSRKSGAQVGAVPCITRSITGFKVMTNPMTYLIDTPGIIQPKILHNEDGMRLWTVGSIRDGIIEHDFTVDYILYILNKQKVFKYTSYYGLKQPTVQVDVLMNKVKEKYGMMNEHNAYIAIMKDFREGKLGRITIDGPPEEEVQRRNDILAEIRRMEEEEEKR